MQSDGVQMSTRAELADRREQQRASAAAERTSRIHILRRDSVRHVVGSSPHRARSRDGDTIPPSVVSDQVDAEMTCQTLCVAIPTVLLGLVVLGAVVGAGVTERLAGSPSSGAHLPSIDPVPSAVEPSAAPEPSQRLVSAPAPELGMTERRAAPPVFHDGKGSRKLQMRRPLRALPR